MEFILPVVLLGFICSVMFPRYAIPIAGATFIVCFAAHSFIPQFYYLYKAQNANSDHTSYEYYVKASKNGSKIAQAYLAQLFIGKNDYNYGCQLAYLSKDQELTGICNAIFSPQESLSLRTGNIDWNYLYHPISHESE